MFPRVIFKILKIKLNMPDITTAQLRKTLIDMNYLQVRGEGYMPVFEGNDITTAIVDIVSPSLQNQIITTRNMKAIIKSCVKVS